MKELKEIIASNIVELRHTKNMTQLDLANVLNYSDKAVSKWERAESVPDITVLKQIADYFDVSVDYLLQEEHTTPIKDFSNRIKNNKRFITGLSVLLVWFVATFSYIIIVNNFKNISGAWLIFMYSIPVSFIVWLILNSVWFNKRVNFIIISLLIWSGVAAIYFTFLLFGFNIWLLFILAAIGQVATVLWSRIKRQKK